MKACRVLRTTSTRANTSLARSITLAHVAHPSHVGPTRKRVFLLLQKVVTLLPRTLSIADGAVGPESSLFWSNILERSTSELSSGSDPVPSKATITGEFFYDCLFILEFLWSLDIVCGFNKWAGSHELVTALLEDPFSSDPTYTDILRNRWKNAPSCVNIE